MLHYRILRACLAYEGAPMDALVVVRQRSLSFMVWDRGRCRIRYRASQGTDLVWRDIALVLKVPLRVGRGLLATGDGRAREVAAARLEELLASAAAAARRHLPAGRLKRARLVLPAVFAGLGQAAGVAAGAIGVPKGNLYVRFRQERET